MTHTLKMRMEMSSHCTRRHWQSQRYTHSEAWRDQVETDSAAAIV